MATKHILWSSEIDIKDWVEDILEYTNLDIESIASHKTLQKQIGKNKIKGYLTHGARLNKDVFLKINNSKYVVIGLGPDILLNSKEYNLVEQQGDFLTIIHDNVDPNKILFDVDFRWNTCNEELDKNAIHRIKNIWQQKDVNKILYTNALKFFNLNLIGEIDDNFSIR